MTDGTGIAGAVGYGDALRRAEECFVCGRRLDAPKTKPRARIVPPHGVVQVCGDVCADDPSFAGRLVLAPADGSAGDGSGVPDNPPSGFDYGRAGK